MKRIKLWHKLTLTIIAIITASQITACGNKKDIPSVTTITEVQTETSSEKQDNNLYTADEIQSVDKEEISSISEAAEETASTLAETQTKDLQETTDLTSTNIPANAAPGEVISETKETTAKEPVEVPITKGTQEYTGEITVNTNSASGTESYTQNGATIDASNKASGYIMVKYEGDADKRIKVRITCNQVNYDYDLNLSGNYEAFPLQLGDGSYTVMILQNAYSNQYAVLLKKDITVQLSNANMPYLYPSQRVNFNASSAAVKKSYDLCVGLTTEEQKVTAIYNFVKDTIVYDTEKAAQILSGALTTYVADADNILNIKKGICLDYATLMAVMLRAQNIPTQVIYGTEASAPYHAWNQVYLNGKWILYDATYAAGGATGSNYTELKRY